MLAEHGALGGRALDGSSSSGALVAIAALIGFGAKAGVMPLHVWLPRTHPLAPAHVSALMSGVMIKVALYGLFRVLVDWIERPPLWLGRTVVALGAVSALGGVIYALFQHELKRLLALHSIENIGIILLGLGAALVLRERGDPVWAGVALAAALLHTINHAVFKALLFLGAGAFERAAHELQLDRLGGLLRRMPWTGGAFLIGARGDRRDRPAERVRVGVADAAVAAAPRSHAERGRRHHRGDRARGAGADRCPRRLLLRQGRRLVLLGPAPRRLRRRRRGPVGDARPALVLAAWCVVLGALPGPLATRCAAILRDRPALSGRGSIRPGTGGLPTLASRSARRPGRGAPARARPAQRATAPTWACGQRVEPALNWTSAGFTKPCGSCSSRCCGPSGRSRSRSRAASCSRFPTAAGCRC